MAEQGPILISAGGTGGHLFPAEALAHELRSRGHPVHLVTDSRVARFTEGFPADAVHVVPSATLGSKNPLKLARSLWTLFAGIRQAGALIRRIRPVAVIGFGGYPTVPPLLAATNAGLPTLIHEQNAVMGRANRALAGRVTAIAGGFLPEGSGRHAARTVTTGNPVRPAVLAAAELAYIPSRGDDPFHLVVFGGSQGAQYFATAVPEALGLLPAEFRARIRLTQQARPEDEANARVGLEAVGVAAEVSPFFTNMAARIGAAHLVISRSGASTVSEISVIGRPSILVPYPHALDHDQAANAEALMQRGGAMVIAQSKLSPRLLADMIAQRMADPDGLAATAAQAKAAGKPDATRLLADLAEAIASGMSISEFRSKRS
ncbi:UDP-N-acetylglucosamine-N-acetylmuramylpentapeptide N-acetylglucosamine transferase [Hoeflea marina]|uniref:UDP-N-acetylglucosamine--N-acetylmuramyl-(pentapeptide) pyrophosphoryl-undecaprenol N-acetylglucosamine transferase n=1 Tax=Hoeflea marina TaxID=274592 RepID=A0A317PKW3_9HYPH|nr:UDP-N-acetylglucosamine--N-acetylmuramyl-(pentapeptide) pyrophosphoryl-undecaprenol N-acetylglucosamine transferase [Hoeflea marina]PWV99249.1 UDP-N-acetylglucosamine-N-acetylmuramylpentapeptide N-acetylglucosamine transferase [Hoeflea marina]